MGALYEDVENFFGDIFAWYGRLLSKFPYVFITVSLLSSLLLGIGLLNIEYETDVERLYTPRRSPAEKDQQYISGLFPDQTAKAFYDYQQIHMGSYAELFILPPEEEDNVLTSSIAEEMVNLYDRIVSISLEKDGRGFTYIDLCASRKNVCVIDGRAMISHFKNAGNCINKSATYPHLNDPVTSKPEDISSVLSAPYFSGGCLHASAMRLRFNLRHDTTRERNLALLWEKAFLEGVKNWETKHAKIVYSASESLDIELSKYVDGDIHYFALTIIIMIVYSTFVSSGGNCVSTRVLLAQAGIVAALLALLASCGLLSLCGLKVVDICGVMPFLVLGVGVDDMFILMSGWRATDVHADIETRVADTFRSSAISVTITSLTDLLAFSIGATSPFLIVKNFCIFTGLAIFLCYVNQLTFFGGFLVLHARRVQASRHIITCRRTKSHAQMKADGSNKLSVLCCAGEPPRGGGEDDSLCERLPSSVLPKILMKDITKFLIIIGFIVYLGVSIWGASHIKSGIKLEDVVPDSSYLSDYQVPAYKDMKSKHFPGPGASLMLIIHSPVEYWKDETRLKINRTIEKAQRMPQVDKNVKISWLDDYLPYARHANCLNPAKFVQGLKKFVESNPIYENDIVISSDAQDIIASRFYLSSHPFEDTVSEGILMNELRYIATNSTVIDSIPMKAFSPEFIYYEHNVSILKNTLLSVGVAMIGMLFVALMFIPHPISVTCVLLTMVSIVLGMFGFMHIWGLALSAFTTVQIIISVGFCVDFTVHISHAFMTATGKNRNERVMTALDKVGVPVLNGAVSSILGILMLAVAKSYVFQSFFKTMLLVIMLGLCHALLFLPVMLSFIGPRRTFRPRVFIPISSPATRECAAHKHTAEQRARKRSMSGGGGRDNMELAPLCERSGNDNILDEQHDHFHLQRPPLEPQSSVESKCTKSLIEIPGSEAVHRVSAGSKLSDIINNDLLTVHAMSRQTLHTPKSSISYSQGSSFNSDQFDPAPVPDLRGKRRDSQLKREIALDESSDGSLHYTKSPQRLTGIPGEIESSHSLDHSLSSQSKPDAAQAVDQRLDSQSKNDAAHDMSPNGSLHYIKSPQTLIDMPGHAELSQTRDDHSPSVGEAGWQSKGSSQTDSTTPLSTIPRLALPETLSSDSSDVEDDKFSLSCI